MNSESIRPSEMNPISDRGLKSLRIWIPILLVPAMGLVRFVPRMVENGPSMIWMASAFGPFLIGALVMAWWLFLSRASFLERVVGVVGVMLVITLVEFLVDPSMQGPLVIVMTTPITMQASRLD